MINLRYHIVSLTAVFLAIGIGLTLGSTFLDRATVENLNGQLENLETRLGERDEQIDELQSELEQAEALQTALDDQGTGLLAGSVDDDVPVVVVASRGVDEDDIDGALRSLQTAGADVQGLWWLTDRFLLSNEADIDDLATLLDESSEDPARLRRLAVDGLGAELRARQEAVPASGATSDDELDAPDGPDAPQTTTTSQPAEPDAGAGPATTDPAGTGTTDDEADQTEAETEAPGADLEPDAPAPATPIADALLETGFLTFEPVADGPEVPVLPAGVHLVVVGGSPDVPDDVFVQPLVERIARGADEPTRTVVTSAMGDGAAVSEVVSIVRADDRLRSVVSTVDGLDHFQGWMATVLAVDDLDDGVIGHYGLGEGATALLPPLRTP